MIDEIRPGLYRWVARHPEWKEPDEPGSPSDWPPEVGSVAYAAGDRLVVIDPQVPRDADAFWGEMDRLVERHGPRITVLKTIRFHTRSREAFVDRYGADRPKFDAVAIPGVETIPIPDADETMVWLPELRALVPGDRLLGDDAGGLRMCPESWLRYIDNGLTLDGLRERLARLLDLPIEMVLVSHGDPVLADGRGAVAAVLARG